MQWNCHMIRHISPCVLATYCQIKPENIRHLQNMIQSDQTNMFDRETFHVHVSMSSQTGKADLRMSPMYILHGQWTYRG